MWLSIFILTYVVAAVALSYWTHKVFHLWECVVEHFGIAKTRHMPAWVLAHSLSLNMLSLWENADFATAVQKLTRPLDYSNFKTKLLPSKFKRIRTYARGFIPVYNVLALLRMLGSFALHAGMQRLEQAKAQRVSRALSSSTSAGATE